MPPEALPPPSTGLEEAVDARNTVALNAWVKTRESRAKEPEHVGLPLVRHGPGWGSICPDDDLGAIATSSPEDTVWIDPSFAPSAPAMAPDTRVVAEGYLHPLIVSLHEV